MAIRALLSLGTVIDGIGRLARGVEWAVKQTPTGPTTAPTSDPLRTRSTLDADLGTASRVEYGYIVDAIPGMRQYRVLPEGGLMMIVCTSLYGEGAGGAIGVYDSSSYLPGTHVRYIRHRQTPYSGVIIGAEPGYNVDPTLYVGDMVSQGSNVGLQLEGGYATLVKMGGSVDSIPVNSGLTAYGHRQPSDSLEISELNYSTETGLMLHMDPWMTFLRADETTGIWFFYWDGLTRIAGQHLQEITTVSTREIYDDEGETNYYHGVATYPWENRGMLISPSQSATTEQLDPSKTQLNQAYYARIEPTYDDTQAYHRLQIYEGYLGQGQKTILSSPNKASGYDSTLRYSNKYKPVGLCEQQITMAGHWFVRSALGITIAKRPIIPVPKRMKIVTDASGDGHGNYKASSLYNDGGSTLTDHKVQPTPTPASVSSGEDQVSSATAILDLHAHMFNWEGLHPFYYHKNDYYIPEESAYSYITTNQTIPTWSQLNSSSSQWYLTPPSAQSVTVDHRTGDTAKVFTNTSFLSLLDNGAVVLAGGSGEEIRMVGGSIFLSCPGDVFTEAGRNIIGWAGRDHISRAWNSVDITANGGQSSQGGDVRIKAERNMQLLSANGGGAYGTLIECRSSGPAQYDFTHIGECAKYTGIILKALQSEICQYADNIYLRTCVPSPTTQDPGNSATATINKHGNICLDCSGPQNDWCGDITTVSQNIRHWVYCAIEQIFSFSDNSDNYGVNEFGVANGVCHQVFNGNQYVIGTILAYDDIASKTNVIALNNFLNSSGNTVGALDSTSATNISTAATAAYNYEGALSAKANSASDSWYKTDFGKSDGSGSGLWYQHGRPGDNNMIQSMWASLRADADYASSYFTLYESRWAQMARSSGPGAPKQWTEHDVKSNISSSVTDPFPGNNIWKVSTNVYKKHNLSGSQTMYDYTAQYAKDRGSVYESPVSVNAPTTDKLDGNYPIIGL